MQDTLLSEGLFSWLMGTVFKSCFTLLSFKMLSILSWKIKAQILVKGKRLIPSKEKPEHRAHSSYGAQKKPLIVVVRVWAPCGVLIKGLCVDSRTKRTLWMKPTSNQELTEWLEGVSYRVHSVPFLRTVFCFLLCFFVVLSILCFSLNSILTTVWFFPAMAPYLREAQEIQVSLLHVMNLFPTNLK